MGQIKVIDRAPGRDASSPGVRRMRARGDRPVRVETYRIGPKPHMSAPGRAEARIGAAIDQAVWECGRACPDGDARAEGLALLEQARGAFLRGVGVGRSAGADGGD